MTSEEGGRQWSGSMPTDLLFRVARDLSPPDLLSFLAVCKLWRSVAIKSYPFGQSPLLLSYRHRYDNKFCLYNPLYYKRLFFTASPEVLQIFRSSTSHIVYSKYGWLVFFKYDKPRHHAIVFVNPFISSANSAIIKWRMPKYCTSRTLVSMSAPPTDPACIFILMNSFRGKMKITIGREGGRNWKVETFRYQTSMLFSCFTNPVFHGGMFYCIGKFIEKIREATLGIYDSCRRTWTYHNLGITRFLPWDLILVESDGELLTIFGDREKGFMPFPIIYKLNESSMELEELLDLGRKVLFVDKRSTISVTAEIERMKNRIFYGFNSHRIKKVECELYWSASGDNPRLVPKPHVGLAKMARRVEGELTVMSHHYSSSLVMKYFHYLRRFLDSASLVKKYFHYFRRGACEELEAEEVQDPHWQKNPEKDEDANWMKFDVWVQPNWGGSRY